MLSIVGCMNCSETTDDEKSKAAWQKYHEARKAGDPERLLAVIDSMEQEEIVSPAKADHMRGLGYDAGWQMRIAEHYYKKAYEKYALNPSHDWDSYTDAGYRWACLRFGRGDTEGALNVITGLLPQAKENKAFPKRVEAALLMLMADCQIQLHHNAEARRNWQKAYEIQQSNKDNQAAVLPWISLSISASLFNMGDVEGAQEWLERAELEFPQYEQQGDSLIIEEWKGHFALWRARYLQATGHVAEAAATYAAVPRSYIMEPRGYMEAAEYLMDAGRYDEAAYWYEQMDSSYVATDGAQMTFENISSRLSPRYSAYRKAGRNGDAIVIADSISAAIDSALVWQKKNEASELSIIYQTHEKELALEESEAKTAIYRILAVTTFLICLIIAYLLWRSYKYNKVLTEKNRRLYEQIEQHEQEQRQSIEQLEAAPEESLTAELQLYRRLCALMAEQRPYTDENLNRDTLAQLLGTNAKYVVQTIRECSHGETVGDFINRYRLEYVAHLLKTTDDPIGVIGELSGIPSRVTLSRLFRNAYGMTCREYRQVSQQKE